MKLVSKVLVGASAVALAGLGVVTGRHVIRLVRAHRAASAGATVKPPREPVIGKDEAMTPAGSMFVGAVDEVELSAGIARGRPANADPLAFDPEEVPSEHDEINELRGKMPMG